VILVRWRLQRVGDPPLGVPKDGSRTLVIVASLDAWLDRLKPWRGSVGPLLPPEDRALARERAGEPYLAGVFADHLQRLTPSLGESEAWTRALANTVRAYRSYHDCDFKTAKAAVLALIEPPAEQQQIAIEQASEPEPDQSTSPRRPAAYRRRPDLAAVCAERLRLIAPNVGPDEGRLRAFEYTVGVCCRHYRVDQETGKKMVSGAIKAARPKEPPTP
jgi:hypothetical protein